MKAIILVGYMGVGKTTVGRHMAMQLNCSFYDLDWYIEERFRKKIPQIFAEQGEDAFRDLERRMLHEVAEFENVVVSCGGGTPCFFDNMDYMNSVATTIFMKATPETIIEHLKISKSERPLLSGKSPEELHAFITEQLQNREPFYQKAQHEVLVNVLNNKENVIALVKVIIQQIQNSISK
ncbi:MAG: shikimate kinase [Bacteroidaceae bacterium]|nr:shikimate kinase [Bacteroidaceae bacterium]